MRVRRAISIPPVVPIRVTGPLGSKDLDALLDTGATYCILSPEDAEDLGYAPTQASQVRVATAGGLLVLPRLTLAAVEVLGLRRAHVLTLIRDLSDSGLEAIIGWSFLDQLRLTIDARHKPLTLADR